jgi:general secretion pathway protein A
MYLAHYNLQSKPFEITVDPRFLWLGEKHQEALATLEYGIREEKGFLLLTGEVGAGKTVLINGLARKLDIQSIIATVPDPGLSALDFFNSLAATFGMDQTFNSKGAFLAHLKKFLMQADTDKRKVLLLIDEAQRLHHEILEEIRLLSNIELENRKLINIFFVGQNEFNNILMDPRNRAVRHRIAVRYHITNLTLQESAHYIMHRLKVAGSKQKIFTADAVKEIFNFAGGNPRLTNIICDHALLTGYTKDQKTIDADVVKECARELRLPPEQRSLNKDLPVGSEIPETAAPPPKRPSVLTFLAVALIVLLVVAGGYWAFTLKTDSPLPWSPDEIVPQQPPKQLLNNPPEAGAPDSPAATRPEESRPRIAPPESRQPAAPIQVPVAQPGAEPAPPETPASESTEGEMPAAQSPWEANATQTAEEESAAAPAPPEPAPAETAGVDARFDLNRVDQLVIPFKHNSNELSAETYRLLDGFAASLLDDSGYTVSIRGYTDTSGALSYNMSISQFRANMIKSYLVGKGVAPERITAVGLGPEDPVAANDTEAGRRQNRRVEIEFVKKE